MAHSVAVNLTSHPLSREENAVTFVVDDNGTRYGELRVSRGGLRWRPRNKQDHHFITWQQLDDMMRARPRR